MTTTTSSGAPTGGRDSYPISAAVANFRSLGGLPTADGAAVRHGVLYRSGHLAEATDDDIAVLARLGIRRVIDLRRGDETATFGPDRVPSGCDLVVNPILERAVTFELSDRSGRTHEVDIMSLIYCEQPELVRELVVDGAAAALMEQLYELFVTDATARAQFGNALRALAEPEKLPAVVHCTAGKDRTGWLVAIVLLLLGVDEDTVVADFIESNARRASNIAETRARWAELDVDPDLLMPFVLLDEAYIRRSITAMSAHWGGLGSYVHAGLGIGDDVTTHLREVLRDDGTGPPPGLAT